jgi:hypothetical protein
MVRGSLKTPCLSEHIAEWSRPVGTLVKFFPTNMYIMIFKKPRTKWKF